MSAPSSIAVRGVGLGPDAAAHRQRDEELAATSPDGVRERAPPLERGGDVEDDELVDALDVVAPGEGGRIAGVRAGPRT